MHIKHKKIDRTFFKTHQSRSIKFSSNKSFGFTLIELLVVISIIALLSTIVLAAVNDARVKARNTAKNEIVLQYINALELYASSNNGTYPDSHANSSYYSCLGFTETENCHPFYTGLDSLNTAIKTYYPETPKANEFSVYNGLSEMKGIQYKKLNSSYELVWVLNKKANCIRGATNTYNSSKSYTTCTYPQ